MSEATALRPGELRTYAEKFEELRVAIRETYEQDPDVLLHVRFELDGSVITHAMGSTDLCLSALTEAFQVAAPFIVQSSYVRITIGTAGTRKAFVP